MQDWNIIVTTQDHKYKQVRDYLKPFGHITKTDYYNVLTLLVDDVDSCMEQIREKTATDPEILHNLARFIPLKTAFRFQTVEEFEQKSKRMLAPWIGEIAGKTFHVRMHRRGFKGRLSSQKEEQFLDFFLLEKTAALGKPSHIDFDNPDLIIAIETIGQKAGMSLWSREDRARFPFLKLD